MQLHHMPNLNRPRIVSADKLTAADIDECIARRRQELDAARPKPLPPMDFQPHQAAHAASEIDDEPEPLTGGDWLWIRVLAWASLLIIVGGVALVLR